MILENEKVVFSKDVFKFFEDLENNNNKKFFDENRKRYEESVVAPSKAYIKAMAPFFNQLHPEIRTEPKFNQTLMRISKDMRFTKGEPYRNYFLIHFGRFKLDSEFYVYFNKTGLSYGLFLNKSGGDDLYFKENFNKYKEEIGEIFLRYKINGNYSFSELKMNPINVKEGFNFSEDAHLLEKPKLILFEKNIEKENNLSHSPEILNFTTSSFLQLYPLYCFAVSPNPINLLEKFEENFSLD